MTDIKTTDLIPQPLTLAQISHASDLSHLPKTSKTRMTGNLAFAQSRAVRAMTTALDISASGYHVFALGENGLGKRTLITRLLAERAKNEPTPDDWVYVHNFADARRPIAMSFTAGTARTFQKTLHKLYKTTKKRLTAKFLGDSYQNQVELIKGSLASTQNSQYQALTNKAKKHNLTLVMMTDGGGQFVASDDSLPIDEEIRAEFTKQMYQINAQLENLEDKIFDKLDKLSQKTALSVLEPLFAPVLEQFANHKKASAHIKAMQKDILTHMARIISEDDDDFIGSTLSDVPSRYVVNVLTEHKETGSPIVFEDLPTHLNLLGHIEYATELGTVYSDVSMIRAGALHKANGGYLILDAHHLLEHPYAWQGLKRALQSKQIRIASLEQMLTLTGSLSLEPDGIPLNVKVILLGDVDVYEDLFYYDPEFRFVCGVRADFNEFIDRTRDSEQATTLLMCDIIKAHKLPTFDNTALFALLNALSDNASDRGKLDIHTGRLTRLILQSARMASVAGVNIVTSTHVLQALQENQDSQSHVKELYYQEIYQGQQLISTQGQAVGQINALTVLAHADSEFGLPARLTALVTPKFGEGEIIDIERDVELGGNIHAKGVLIMSHYLRSLFSQNHALNFSASLVFEQSYGQIDGDSATLAETCVLLSALGDVPLSQNLAITGSMNQFGQAQAIGGVSAKIAGFFDICKQQGLDGTQGVIIPNSNIRHLTLRPDILKAIETGEFKLYGVDNVRQALGLLTGLAIDDKNKKGDYKKGCVFAKISERLASWDLKDDDKGDKDDKGKK